MSELYCSLCGELVRLIASDVSDTPWRCLPCGVHLAGHEVLTRWEAAEAVSPHVEGYETWEIENQAEAACWSAWEGA